jgi:DNA repair exonuclease SbcCD nuclease subunit
VHLGSDGYGDAEQQAAHHERYRRAFRRVIDRALADRVDLLLIAGDLFDHNRVSDETVAFAHGELNRLRQPVVILPGNHDALSTNAIYDRHDVTAGASHVHVIRRLDGQTIDIPELDALVWGRAMEEHTPAFRPLDHIPGRDRRRWCLVMAHGFFYEDRRQAERSSPIFAEEVRDTGWDYVALGHQHVQTNVSQGGVAAYYSGAPVIEWRGAPPGGSALRVDFSEQHGVRVEARPVF